MLASGPASRLLRLQFAAFNPRQRQNHVHVALFRSGRIATKDRSKRFSASAAADTVELVKELKLISGAHCIPHPEKAATGGEDAHFVSATGGGVMGVADGVGGWADSGISPAEYSRGFMKAVENFLEGKPIEKRTVKGIEGKILVQHEEEDADELRGAFEAAQSSLRIPGSCTACVLRLNQETKKLIGLNLGDSGFMVIRRGRVFFKTPPMQHYFDCPCQFGACPEYVDMTDSAEDAREFTFRAKPGDIIVMGTDGLWDNCPDEEIIELLPKDPKDIDESVVQIAQRALLHSQDQEFDSPYTQAAREYGYDIPWWQKLLTAKLVGWRPECGKLVGGKSDDITVVAGFVELVPIEVEAPPVPEEPEPILQQNSVSVSEEIAEKVAASEEVEVPEQAVIPGEVKISEEVVVPEQTEVPEKVVVSEETKIPEKVVVPEETEAPQKVVVPEETEAPEKVVVSEEAKAPEKMVVSEETEVPEKVAVSEETEVPENVVVSEETEVPEKVVVSEEAKAPEKVVASEEAKVSEKVAVSEEAKVSENAVVSEEATASGKVASEEISGKTSEEGPK